METPEGAEEAFSADEGSEREQSGARVSCHSKVLQ